MEITKDTKIMDIIKEYPWLPDKAKEKYPELKQVDTPIGRMMAKKLTLADAAKMGNFDVEEIIEKIKSYIEKYNEEKSTAGSNN